MRNDLPEAGRQRAEGKTNKLPFFRLCLFGQNIKYKLSAPETICQEYSDQRQKGPPAFNADDPFLIFVYADKLEFIDQARFS